MERLECLVAEDLSAQGLCVQHFCMEQGRGCCVAGDHLLVLRYHRGGSRKILRQRHVGRVAHPQGPGKIEERG